MLTGKEYFYPYFKNSIIALVTKKTVLDIGTSCRFRKELTPFKKYFHKNYFALGYKLNKTAGKEAIDINGSIYALPFKDNAVEAVLCLSVFEHLYDPFKAAGELYRILKPGGRTFITVPFMLGEHAKEGDFYDYFRFTQQGIKYVFKSFTHIEISPQGGAVYCRIAMFPALLKVLQNSFAMKIIKYLDSKTRMQTTVGWMVNLVK